MDSLRDPLTNFRQQDIVQEASRFLNRLASSFTPSSHPSAILLGGQPGAGKSTLTETLAKQFQGNVVTISGDDFRKLHPNHEKLVAKYGKDATPAASAFSGAMTEYLIDKVSADKYNLVIEGTLRTTDVPLRTCQLLKERGYNVFLACLAVRPEVSYISTLYRYEMMRERGATPRATSKAAHDQTVLKLPENLNTLYGTRLFQHVKLYQRDGQCIYDSTVDKSPPADTLQAIQRGRWSREETEQLLDLVERTEALMAARNAPELPGFIRERMELLGEELEPPVELEGAELE